MDEDLARVAYKCKGCGESADLEKEIKHKTECNTKFAQKVCSKSGTAPHVGPAK